MVPPAGGSTRAAAGGRAFGAQVCPEAVVKKKGKLRRPARIVPNLGGIDFRD